MSIFREKIKSQYPKKTGEQIAQQLGYSNSTKKRYRYQRNMPRLYTRKTTKKEEMSSKDDSIRLKSQDLETENNNLSG